MHPKHPSSLVLISAGLLALAGCSRSDAPEDVVRSEAAESAAGSRAIEAAPPGLTTSAAAGVAFAYTYAFTLPAKAISGVQQQHAAACEALGTARCQITGMSFDQPREGQVEARLDLLVAPDIAQRFGGQSVAAVEQADGKLETASIQGDDAGGAIEQSQRQSAGLKSELARIEKRLIAKGLGQDERSELTRRADELRGQLRSEQVLRQDKEASLATTPMHFAYGSEGLFAGGSDPFGKAAANSFGSFKALLAFLLTFAGLILPWALVTALIVLFVRHRALKQRLAMVSAEPTGAGPAAPQ